MVVYSSSLPDFLLSFVCILFFVCCTGQLSSNIVVNGSKGFTVEIFHRTSPHYTVPRNASNSSTLLPSSRLLGGFELEVSPIADLLSYYAKLSIGTPPVEFVARIDTGADLTWSQCEPCRNCFPQALPIFDSRRSSTYKSLRNDSRFCDHLEDGLVERLDSDESEHCKYWQPYDADIYTEGVLSSETLTFDSISSGEKVEIPSVAFGCSYAAEGQGFTPSIYGAMGLGQGRLSLVSQLGSSFGEKKFSYCFVPRDHKESGVSKLKFGDHVGLSDRNAKVQQTPFLPTPPDGPKSFYYLDLQDISVNDKRLNIPTTASLKDDDDEFLGFTIDSGTARIELVDGIYNVVESSLRKAIVGLEEIDYPLCYKFNHPSSPNVEDGDQSNNIDGLNLPNITLHFAGGADWWLPPKNTFVAATDDDGERVICSLIHRTSAWSSLGTAAQQNVYVEYDLENQVLSFAPTDCTGRGGA